MEFPAGSRSHIHTSTNICTHTHAHAQTHTHTLSISLSLTHTHASSLYYSPVRRMRETGSVRDVEGVGERGGGFVAEVDGCFCFLEELLHLGFRVQGSGFKIQGSGFRVKFSGSRLHRKSGRRSALLVTGEEGQRIACLQGYLAHKRKPASLGPPKGHSPTVGY